MAPLRDDERRDPLPGLLGLPGHVLRQISPRTRRIVLVSSGAAIVAAAVGAVLLVPAVDEAKERDAAADREDARERRAERIARLRAELRPRARRAPQFAVTPGRVDDDDALLRRHELVRELERAVEQDAQARVKAGELDVPVQAVQCKRFPRRASGPPPEDVLSERIGRYECLALTSQIIGGDGGAHGAIGYPFRARIDFRTGRYAFCKISGRAGEGGLRGRPLVKVPRACGGS